MVTTQSKDARLKKAVKEVIEKCQLSAVLIDREVQINTTRDKDPVTGNYLTEKEIDVVVKFSHGGRRVLLLFECEDSVSAKGIKRHYREYWGDVKDIRRRLAHIRVIKSSDNQLKGHHFKDVDVVGVCFVYGGSFPDSAYRTCLREAKRYRFLVWNYLALVYYQKISSVLNRWTKYELFRDFDLDLEPTSTFAIEALEARQKGKTMYVGRMHPGQLLKIAYVVRRASEKKYAYQRMLSRDRIAAIAEFISSDDPQSFLPNAVVAVFDDDPKVKRHLRYDPRRRQLTIPLIYCSAWIIDGQHRAYGFLGTTYEDWTPESFEPFDLPVILFRELPQVVQTQTFININYFQKRIKSGLLCDLTTLTKDLQHKLTWPSLIGRELNEIRGSPLRDKVKVSELHAGKPIGLSSLVQYGLLETLLGYKPRLPPYSGPLFTHAPFNRSASFDSEENRVSFGRQVELLVRFLDGVEKNTRTGDLQTDPWRNTKDYSLLKPTGINALFMVLAKILLKHPDGGVDFESFLKPLRYVSFKRDYVAKKGGGWKGFRGLANTILRKLNRGKRGKKRMALYGEKERV